jgi:type IV pilus assembly protein PilC
MTAMFYPIVLLCFSFAVVIFLIMTILPAFAKMYLDAGVKLPLPTRILYGINLLIRQHWLLLAIFFSGLTAFVIYARKKGIGKSLVDKLVLDLPLWGPMQKKVQVANFCRTLSSLLNAGVPMLQALETLEKTTENAVFAGIIRSAYENVRKGGTLSEVMKNSGEFPPMASKMAAVGEEAGPIDKMLAKVADFYEMSVDYALKRFAALLEPIFLVLVGGIVGFILASVIMPIFQMASTLRR